MAAVQTLAAYHEDDDEHEADSHYDEEGDQVVLQRQGEFGHEDNVTTGGSVNKDRLEGIKDSAVAVATL